MIPALRLLGAVAVVLVAGCDSPSDEPERAYPSITLYKLGAGNYVREFHLTDGTRCVVHSSDSGIACDWRAPPAKRDGE